MSENFIINPDEAHKVIDKLVEQGDSKEVGIFISLLSYRYMQTMGIIKEQFMTSLSNSINKLENEEQLSGSYRVTMLLIIILVKKGLK